MISKYIHFIIEYCHLQLESRQFYYRKHHLEIQGRESAPLPGHSTFGHLIYCTSVSKSYFIDLKIEIKNLFWGVEPHYFPFA